MSGLLKKVACYALVVLGIFYGYQWLTGKSITTLPGEIVAKIQGAGNGSVPDKSTNPKYYTNPDERMKNGQ